MKRQALRVGKVGVSLFLLALILYLTDVGRVVTSLATADLALIAAASSLFFVGYTLTSMRWRLLLALRSAKASLAYLIRSFLVASFFNNLLPSSVGGDIVRVYDSWRLGIGKGAALSTVAMDRALGVLALGTYALVGVALSSVQLGVLAVTVLLTIVITMSSAFLILFSNRRVLGTISRFCEGHAIGSVVGRIVNLLQPFAGQRRVLLQCFLLSLVLQGNVIVFYWLSAKALGLPVGIVELALVVPITLILLMIPITINGVGLREGIFVFLLAGYGIASADAVAFSLLIYLQTVMQGLLGGVVFLFRSERRFNMAGPAPNAPVVNR